MNKKHMNKKNFLALSLSLLIPTLANALTFPLPPNGENVVGSIQHTYSQPGETMGEVGRRYDIGYHEMIEANPDINPDKQLSKGTELVIPSRFVLPHAPRVEVVINLAELRLYYYPPGEGTVITEPVGIGRVGWYTPVGTTKIVAKVKDPSWRPTPHVRAEAEKIGYMLPEVWPPGPDNPLGAYALRLGWASFLIHGTNNPDGVGKRSSAGCIRMFPEDIDMLFHRVKVGSSVTVVNNPIKVGWQGGQLFIEAHKPLEELGGYQQSDTIELVNAVHAATQNSHVRIQWQHAYEAVKEKSGLPAVIGLEESVDPHYVAQVSSRH